MLCIVMYSGTGDQKVKPQSFILIGKHGTKNYYRIRAGLESQVCFAVYVGHDGAHSAYEIDKLIR